MDGMIQIHQGWLQLAVAGLAFFGWGWRILANMEARIDKRLDKLDGRIDKLDGRMSDLEKGQVHLHAELGHLRGHTDSEMGNLKEHVDAEIGHVKERLDSIDRKLDAGPLGMTAVMAGFRQMPVPFPSQPQSPAIENE